MLKTGIVWFTDNLRFNHNKALNRAIEQCDQIVCAYVINPKTLHKIYKGIPAMGSRRMEFMLEALTDLKTQLKQSGGELVILMGDETEALAALVKQHQATGLYGCKAITWDEINLQEKVANTLEIECHFVWDNFLIEPQKLPFELENLPPIFTNYRKIVEAHNWHIQAKNPNMDITFAAVPDVPLPTLESLAFSANPIHPKAAIHPKGGESAAMDRMQHYFTTTQAVSTYKETRNGLLGADYSTKFSFWLAHGCISPQQIWLELKKYEAQFGANESTYWVIFELLWRDYFRLIALQHGPKIFLQGGIKGTPEKTVFNREVFKTWTEGKTADDFVNANMIELRETGFMSNRGRQNVASYLVHDLHQPWQLGAAWFQHHLIDYDAASNWGNWCYLAGIGNDPRPNRKFNTQKQANDYDANGEYRRYWL